MGNPSKSKLISHCWVEHNGEVAQTNNISNMNIIATYCVELVPNDIDASKKLIVDLIETVNNSV
jgi:hypothetical protein